MENNIDLNSHLQEQLKIQQNWAYLEGIAKKKMTREAIARYGAVKLTHSETAMKAALVIAQAVEQGMEEMIDDEKFKQILIELQRKK